MKWQASYSKFYGLRIWYERPTSGIAVVASLMIENVRDGDALPRSNLFPEGSSETEEFMQAMLDAAYEAGLRPSTPERLVQQVPPPSPELALVQAHLDDMRKILSATIGVPL